MRRASTPAISGEDDLGVKSKIKKMNVSTFAKRFGNFWAGVLVAGVSQNTL